jgi:hypothetical protein
MRIKDVSPASIVLLKNIGIQLAGHIKLYEVAVDFGLDKDLIDELKSHLHRIDRIYRRRWFTTYGWNYYKQLYFNLASNTNWYTEDFWQLYANEAARKMVNSYCGFYVERE